MAILADRDRRAANAARRSILDSVAGQLDGATLTLDLSGFPKLNGTLHGDAVRVALIPDTMTIRRLPQLWLEVTLLCDLPLAGSSFAALVRPSGNDYYSLTERFTSQLLPPRSFPAECLVKGESASSQTTLDCVAECASRLFSDPKVKEFAATQNGLRIIRQLAEGKRGEHLLLRQSVFVDARAEPRDLDHMTTALQDLKTLLASPAKASAA